MKNVRYRKAVRRISLVLAVLAASALALCLIHPEDKASVSNVQERLDYLSALGWEADGSSEERQEVILPREFGDVMAEYAVLQREQGFDLEAYAGREISIYSYKLTNWPDKSLTVIADLYIYKEQVIAGDVHSTALNGFMIGLK